MCVCDVDGCVRHGMVWDCMVKMAMVLLLSYHWGACVCVASESLLCFSTCRDTCLFFTIYPTLCNVIDPTIHAYPPVPFFFFVHRSIPSISLFFRHPLRMNNLSLPNHTTDTIANTTQSHIFTHTLNPLHPSLLPAFLPLQCQPNQPQQLPLHLVVCHGY